MSTTAQVAIETSDGWLHTSINFDGYPSHIMPILETHHADELQALALVEGGEIRGLEETGEVERYSASDSQPSILHDVPSRSACFLYVYADGKWSNRTVS